MLINMVMQSTILERVIDPRRGGFPPELARQILKLDFPPEDHARYQELSQRAQDGTLTPGERTELEDYLNVNDFLTILKAKADTSLRQQVPAA